MHIITLPETPYTGVFGFDPVLDTLDHFETNSGQRAALLHTHVDWVVDGVVAGFDATSLSLGMSPKALANELVLRDTALALSWDPFSIDFLRDDLLTGGHTPRVGAQAILDGYFDVYIRSFAQEIGALDMPILISLFGEADSNALFAYGANGDEFRDLVTDPVGHYGDPSLPDGPERVRDVFRHVIDLFREEGVENATWFTYLASDLLGPEDSLPPGLFYAGDDYIDWVGQSLYVETAAGLAASFQAGYEAWGEVTSKPFFIPEMGLVDTSGAEVGALLAGLSDYDRVVAYLWTDFEGQTEDWGVARLGDEPSSWGGFEEAGPVSAQLAVITAEGQQEFETWRILANQFAGTDSDDFIEGNTGANVMEGGRGDDTYLVDDPEDIVIECLDAGNDTVLATVSFTLPENVENGILLEGTGLTLTGNTHDNLLVGNGSPNVLDGVSGNDTLVAGGGGDTLIGGEGDDTFIVNSMDDVVVEHDGEGFDMVITTVSFTVSQSVEMVISSGEDALELSGSMRAETLVANDAGNVLRGIGGDNTLIGGAGNDTLIGGDGNDMLVAGGGNNVLIGGEGNDTFIGGAGDDTLVLGWGADYAVGGAGADTFVINPLGALAVIGDFDWREDTLNLTMLGLADRAEVDDAAFDTGDGMFLWFGEDQLLLEGIDQTAFFQSNILI